MKKIVKLVGSFPHPVSADRQNFIEESIRHTCAYNFSLQYLPFRHVYRVIQLKDR